MKKWMVFCLSFCCFVLGGEYVYTGKSFLQEVERASTLIEKYAKQDDYFRQLQSIAFIIKIQKKQYLSGKASLKTTKRVWSILLQKATMRASQLHYDDWMRFYYLHLGTAKSFAIRHVYIKEYRNAL
jgi:hypothetical protein